MDINIDVTKLTPEGRQALRDFARVGKNYFNSKPEVQHHVSPVGVERIKQIPDWKRVDFIDVKNVLLACPDPELREFQEEHKRLDVEWGNAFPGTPEARRLNDELVKLQKDLIKWCEILKV